MEKQIAKMSRTLCGVAALMGLGVLASCSSEEVVPNNQLPENAVHFSANVQAPVTRMVNSAWEQNDEVGVKVNGVVKTYYITNTATGEMSTNDADPFPWEGTQFDVTAWYPRNNVHIEMNQQDNDDAVKTYESLLAAQTTVTDRNASLTFKHQLARLDYNLQGGIGYTDEEVNAAKVTFLGYAAADFNDGVLNPVGEQTAEITPRYNKSTAEDGTVTVDGRNGTSYMVPAEYWDKPMVKIEIAGDVFYYIPRHSVAEDEAKQRGVLKAGTALKLYFWVDKSKQTIRVKFQSSNIEGWDMGNYDGGRADLDGAQQ